MAIKITKNGTAGAQDRAPAAKTYQEGSSQGKASGRIKITKIERPQTAAKQKWTVGNIGQYGAGNIDLYDRPQYRNANGSISTVDSTSYNIDGQEVLLPTVWNRNGTPYHSSNDEEILQRYADIERSIAAIINDKGQENFAAAKRVELMLDNMLSNGYRDIHGGYHEPNADYLEAKQAIPGASETAAVHEELPLWDIEEKNGGTTHGTEIKPAEPAEEGGADAVGAQSDLHGGDGGRRPYGDGTGGTAQLRQQPKSGSIERLHENVRRNRARTGGERSKENGALIQARQAAAALEPLVSSAEVGVSLGTDTKMLHVLPRNAWDQELFDVEAAAKQAGIREVVMVTGLLQVDGGGSPVSITGVAERETNRIVMRVDSRKKTASELGLHEIAHFRSTRENVEAFAAAVQDSGDGWRDTLEEYRERYKGAANNYEGMTPEDADLYVWEEIMGDAYAGIDCFGQTASQYHTEAVRAIDDGSGVIPAQEAQRASSAIRKETLAASDRKTGPPARFSYAGRNANGANLDSLREAQEMQAAGADMSCAPLQMCWAQAWIGWPEKNKNDAAGQPAAFCI